MAKGLLGLFPSLNRVITVDLVPLECWLERKGCCRSGGGGARVRLSV